MSRKTDLTTMVSENLTGTYKTSKPRVVPLPADIPLGQEAVLLEATALFIDIRQSSASRTRFAARPRQRC